LTCSIPHITDVHLSATPAIIRSDSPYQYQLLADNSNGTTTDVTASSTWITDPSIASISSNGVASCNNPGNTTLSVTFSGMTIQSSFTCVLRSITPNPGFVEAAKTFDGPFASWIDVKAVFGAKGDSVTDDTSALQAALNSLVQHPAVLWIPHGNYLISGPLTIKGLSNITILGEDPLTTTITWIGPQGGTMFTLSGCNDFNIGRITWDGRSTTNVALEVTWDGVSSFYPTRNLIHDSRIINNAIGIQTGEAGETTVARVHFDHNTMAGINEGDYNSLNFNVVDSLFTDNTIGITNIGGGAFNVTNSVFVRSTSTDIALNNTGPFSIRSNLSVDSKMFFWTGETGAVANIIIQGNTIYHPGSDPIINGTPGTLLLLDNQFLSLDPNFHILISTCNTPITFISTGNSYSVSQPFSGNIGRYTSIDEATRSADPRFSLTVPTEVYIPPLSHRPVYEVATGSTSDTIQAAINAAIAAGGIVHLPAGNYGVSQTLEIPPNASVGILGDGQLTDLGADINLQGPILSSYGKSVQLEDVRFSSYSSSATTALIELHEPDTPKTRIFCDECAFHDSNTSDLEVDGIDDAAIEFRVASFDNTQNWAQTVHGGIARQNGIETLGSFGEFMTSSAAYRVDLGGHLLVEDGWHDAGQGNTQFVLTGDGSVTHQGGTVYSWNNPAMSLNNYKGRLSLLGIGTNSYLSVNAGFPSIRIYRAILS
jgi:pectin methylesterase-like acyl-CoA thioesterase